MLYSYFFLICENDNTRDRRSLMTDNLTLNMDAYLPLRDVVFNTLREAILKGELKPG